MTENGPQETDRCRVRVWALTQALKAHGYDVEVAESASLLAVPGTSGSPVVVSCDRRPECDGELWFFSDGAPVAPADDKHMPETIVVLKGMVAGQSHVRS